MNLVINSLLLYRFTTRASALPSAQTRRVCNFCEGQVCLRVGATPSSSSRQGFHGSLALAITFCDVRQLRRRLALSLPKVRRSRQDFLR